VLGAGAGHECSLRCAASGSSADVGHECLPRSAAHGPSEAPASPLLAAAARAHAQVLHARVRGGSPSARSAVLFYNPQSAQ